MTRIFYRTLFLLFVLAGLRVSAQTRQNDVALWTVGSYMANTTIAEDEGFTLAVIFDEKIGYGLSANHFWTDQFSTELALMTFNADLNVASAFTDGAEEIGELNGRAVTAMAQWHFLRDRAVSPYVSAGVAHIGGSFDPIAAFGEGDEPEIDLESEVTWAAAIGMNIRLTERFALTFEAKRIPFDALEEGGLEADEIPVDPMLYGTGVRFRF